MNREEWLSHQQAEPTNSRHGSLRPIIPQLEIGDCTKRPYWSSFSIFFFSVPNLLTPKHAKDAAPKKKVRNCIRANNLIGVAFIDCGVGGEGEESCPVIAPSVNKPAPIEITKHTQDVFSDRVIFVWIFSVGIVRNVTETPKRPDATVMSCLVTSDEKSKAYLVNSEISLIRKKARGDKEKGKQLARLNC
jgi:hypothetical protein